MLLKKIFIIGKDFKKNNLNKACSSNEKVEESDLKRQANFSVCCSALFSDATAVVAVSENGED